MGKGIYYVFKSLDNSYSLASFASTGLGLGLGALPGSQLQRRKLPERGSGADRRLSRSYKGES